MIIAQNVSKTYKAYIKHEGIGFFRRQYAYTKAVDDVSFAVDEGEILGLVGLNGAGKTSMIKLVSGIMRRDAGEIKVMGADPFHRNLSYRKAAALVLGQNGQLDNDLTILDSVSFYSAVYGIRKDEAVGRARKMAIEMMLTEEDLQKQVRSLSLGQRMKGELILAFNHLPKVIFLDEPTLGLDFMAQKAIRGFLIAYVEENKASMILTSHYGKDIEELCKNILVLYEGRSVYYGSLFGLKSAAHTLKEIRFRASRAIADQIASELNVELLISNDSYTIYIRPDQYMTAMLALGKSEEIGYVEFVEGGLDTVIEELYRGQSE